MFDNVSSSFTSSTCKTSLRILYVGMKYDYGKPEQGFSFEHCNFYDSLRQMGHQILYFDFMNLLQENGRKWMNRRLLEVVKAEKPDLMFTILFTNEFEPEVIQEISTNTETVTLNWFCDDHWRFDNFSRLWAPRFNWVVTTAQSALPKYAQLGYEKVIKSQWGCNHFLYRKLDLPLKYDVSFVGQPHGNRRQVIETLSDAGIKVCTWGRGWETGRLSQEAMIQVFNQSRINLNLPNSYLAGHTKNPVFRLTSHCLNFLPYGTQIKSKSNEWYIKSKKILQISSQEKQHMQPKQDNQEQIKGRNFEVPGCGGFLLTGKPENLEEYYQTDREVVCFESNHDLIEKIRYYLEHEVERAEIAHAGYERTLRDHTYVHRLTEIFQEIGLLQNNERSLEDNTEI